MKKVVAFAIFAAVLAFALAVQADTIILTNGDKIEGEILEESPTAVKIQTQFGPITLPRQSISRILKAGPINDEYKEKAKELAK
jgi:hypothetical protein